MKTLITILTLSIVTVTPMLAQAAPRSSAHESQQVTQSPHIYWQGRDIGADPDPNVRLELQRDANYYGGQY
jgi:hypothetical protein